MSAITEITTAGAFVPIALPPGITPLTRVTLLAGIAALVGSRTRVALLAVGRASPVR